MTLAVLAPLGGVVHALADVPDAVFAGEVVGAGVAVEPAEGATGVLVVAPVAGLLAKVHPHAFVIAADGGDGVLVHLGIDTVKLKGEGFTVHAAQGSRVAAGDPVVTFDPTAVRAGGLSAIVPVVVLQSPAGSVDGSAVGSTVAASDALFTWGGAA